MYRFDTIIFKDKNVLKVYRSIDINQNERMIWRTMNIELPSFFFLLLLIQIELTRWLTCVFFSRYCENYSNGLLYIIHRCEQAKKNRKQNVHHRCLFKCFQLSCTSFSLLYFMLIENENDWIIFNWLKAYNNCLSHPFSAFLLVIFLNVCQSIINNLHV